MENLYENQCREDVIKFIKLMISRFFERIQNRENPNIRRLYVEINTSLVREIEKVQKNKSFEEDMYREKENTLEKLYKLLESPEIINEIRSKSISQELFFIKYAEDILGKNKRSYDMSDLYNSDLIVGLTKKKVGYKTFPSTTEYEFKDLKGRIIRITPIGELAYETITGVRSSLVKYRIQRETSKGDISEVTVFSEIAINMMQDDDYREAILNELLSANNIALSNCRGYIGKIENRAGEDKQDMDCKEKRDLHSYSYRINARNVLVFDSEDVSAVIDYQLGRGINLDHRPNRSGNER